MNRNEFDDPQSFFEGENSLSRPIPSANATPNTFHFKNQSFSPYRQSNSNSNAHPNLFGAVNMNSRGADSCEGTPMKFTDRMKYDLYPTYDSQQYESNNIDLKQILKSQDYVDSYVDEPLTLMWSNEASKPYKQQRNLADEPYHSVKKKFNGGGFGFTKYEEFDNELSREDMNPFVKMESDLSRIFPKKIEAEPSSNSQIIPLMEVERPHKTRSQGSFQKVRHSPPKYSPERGIEWLNWIDNLLDDDKDDDDLADPKNRSSRGLRVLSLKVKDIVNEKKKTSYKEVAETLIKELNKKLKAQSQSQSV
jgi:hypothetical protein